ncbi:Aquaporin TIP4-1 [Tetrabaena socialis]|uniref:Aquaporin TIP4-1 n=1 Tax=Tetrabaena socialis TaxID=47790 RepID=A0A2J7ZJ97_9CHLO|nr:Aquaporin TIP4-1 [Tetrabaena socialis]|eukprot:PNH00337.1 Aquaporin TIP4-1 [Tetrabaena socialis]
MPGFPFNIWSRIRSWFVAPDAHRSRLTKLISRVSVEFTACMMFHFIGSISPTPWANGIALTVLVYYTAKISGAHLNPAVTLTFCLLGHTHPIDALMYWVAQVTGCAAGALWIAGLVPGLNMRNAPSGEFQALSGCFTPAAALTPFQVFAWETVSTTCFIVPIFSVVWYTQHKNGYGNSGPLIVGLSLAANALACGRFTGASLNPARSLASPIVFQCPYPVYSYVLGELLGGILATLAVVPWYGISRSAWYRVPSFFFGLTMKNQRSIKLQTISEVDSVVQTRVQLPSTISASDICDEASAPSSPGLASIQEV